MNILISACLAGRNCRYNGKTCENLARRPEFVGHHLILFCSEEDAGLPTPRDPAEIIDGKVMNAIGEEVTAYYLKGAEMALKKAKENHCFFAILKEKSPSCGSQKIYDGTFSEKLIPGEGITARLLKENGIAVFNEYADFSCLTIDHQHMFF